MPRLFFDLLSLERKVFIHAPNLLVTLLLSSLKGHHNHGAKPYFQSPLFRSEHEGSAVAVLSPGPRPWTTFSRKNTSSSLGGRIPGTQAALERATMTQGRGQRAAEEDQTWVPTSPTRERVKLDFWDEWGKQVVKRHSLRDCWLGVQPCSHPQLQTRAALGSASKKVCGAWMVAMD